MNANCDMTIACALRWRVALVGSLLHWGIAHPLGDPHFKYREYTDAQRSLEAAIVKKAELWLCIHFCQDAWNKLVLDRILCKKNRN